MRKRHKEYLVIGLALLCAMLPLTIESKLPRDKVVKVSGNMGMCSGEQVKAPSGDSYILTAAHCRGMADSDGNYTITTEDGKILKRRLIAEDPMSDLMLLEGLPEVQGLTVASVAFWGQRITTLTHGHNFNTWASHGVLIQRHEIKAPVAYDDTPEKMAHCNSMPKSHDEEGICYVQVMETVSTALVVPGSSGGAVLNSSNELVGVVSAGDGTFGSFVTLDDIHSFLRSY